MKKFTEEPNQGVRVVIRKIARSREPSITNSGINHIVGSFGEQNSPNTGVPESLKDTEMGTQPEEYPFDVNRERNCVSPVMQMGPVSRVLPL